MKYFLVLEVESNDWPSMDQSEKASKAAVRVLDKSPGITSTVVSWSVVARPEYAGTKDARLMAAISVAMQSPEERAKAVERFGEYLETL